MAGSRILVVEDDPRLAATVERVLVAEDHDVEIAADGNEALRRARGRPFDLVVRRLWLANRSTKRPPASTARAARRPGWSPRSVIEARRAAARTPPAQARRRQRRTVRAGGAGTLFVQRVTRAADCVEQARLAKLVAQVSDVDRHDVVGFGLALPHCVD
ncbi:MAG: response regulator [Chloroflexi bacterium]|nr:MAG: response regulator [Chloroflexota bacterium]